MRNFPHLGLILPLALCWCAFCFFFFSSAANISLWANKAAFASTVSSHTVDLMPKVDLVRRHANRGQLQPLSGPYPQSEGLRPDASQPAAAWNSGFYFAVIPLVSSFAIFFIIRQRLPKTGTSQPLINPAGWIVDVHSPSSSNIGDQGMCFMSKQPRVLLSAGRESYNEYGGDGNVRATETSAWAVDTSGNNWDSTAQSTASEQGSQADWEAAGWWQDESGNWFQGSGEDEGWWQDENGNWFKSDAAKSSKAKTKKKRRQRLDLSESTTPSFEATAPTFESTAPTFLSTAPAFEAAAPISEATVTASEFTMTTPEAIITTSETTITASNNMNGTGTPMGERTSRASEDESFSVTPSSAPFAPAATQHSVPLARRRIPRWGEARILKDSAESMLFDDDSTAFQPKAIVRVKPGRTASSFAELGVDRELCLALQECGFVRPTPIQAGAFRSVSLGGDVVIASETGSGKTLAYAVPILKRMMTQALQVVILQPNRELCFQCISVLEQLIEALPSHKQERIELTNTLGEEPSPVTDRPCHIFVATPQKALQIFEEHQVFFDVVVLDEGDHIMSNMRHLIEKIFDFFRIQELAPSQWVIVGATMPGIAAPGQDNVRMVILSKWPEATWVRTSNLHHLSEQLEQHFVQVTEDQRDNQLLEWMEEISKKEECRTLIFVRVRELADKITTMLVEKGFHAQAFHKNVSPQGRLYRLKAFNNGELEVMVASPQAARGLDFQGVTHVINYEFPDNAVEYIHCVGRTARNGLPGWAATMYLPDEQALAEAMQALIESGDSLERTFGRKRNMVVRWKKPLEERLEESKAKWEKVKQKKLRQREKALRKELGYWKAQPIIEDMRWRAKKSREAKKKQEAKTRWEQRMAEKKKRAVEQELAAEAKKEKAKAERLGDLDSWYKKVAAEVEAEPVLQAGGATWEGAHIRRQTRQNFTTW